MQNPFPFIIYGAGGHGKVIAETLSLMNCQDVFFWDKNDSASQMDQKVYPPFQGPAGKVILGMGNLSVRKEILAEKGELIDFFESFLCHPTAFVSPSAQIGKATWIGPQAIVHTFTKIGDHSIINSGSIVDHDVHLGNNVHIAPGATLCGHVSIGDHSFVGANAVVIPGIKIGSNVFIKAGSLVKEDVLDGAVI
jgi:acetyltransferase EpsM